MLHNRNMATIWVDLSPKARFDYAMEHSTNVVVSPDKQAVHVFFTDGSVGLGLGPRHWVTTPARARHAAAIAARAGRALVRTLWGRLTRGREARRMAMYAAALGAACPR